MRISLSTRRPSLIVAALSVTLAATVACQTARKASFLPPAQAQAPGLGASGRSVDPPPSASVAEPQAKPTMPSVGAADPIAELIARVEKEYKSGQANCQAGLLDAARRNYESALNLLAASGRDLPSDPRLERELDRIWEAASALDLAADPSLAQSDAAAPQNSQPAPIDETNELTPAVDPKIKAKAEAELKSTHSDLPLVMTDQVAGFINYFSNRGRPVLERALVRSGRYEAMIRSTLRQKGVPEELIYLAQAESGFHPQAVSRAGARGMWQFMGSRAQGYGLERNWWLDERQDPEKATRAAAHHLKDLYNEFGDWYLAMAAYNSGPGTVQSAVKRTGYADFWELYRRNVLPKETRNYVPIILAVTIMAKNPAQYGLGDVVKDKPVPYDTVELDYPIDLRLAAECVDASVADLLDLNPSLLRLTTPKPSKDSAGGETAAFELHLPIGTGAKFEMAVASIPTDKRVWWRYHKVQSGETLASIARAYRTSPKAIADANDLNEGLNNNAVTPDSRLIIPVAAGKEADTAHYARATTRYKIRKGDTVESVAENFGVSSQSIRGWNHLKGSSLAGRKTIYVHLPLAAAASEPKVGEPQVSTKRARKTPGAASPQIAAANAILHHKVRRGETLTSIATSYNTTVTALKQDNRNLAALRPGMILVIRER